MATEMLTVKDVARICSVTVWSVYEWLHKGKLKGSKLGYRQWRIKQEDLEAFVNGRKN